MAGALPHVKVATGPTTFTMHMNRQRLVTPGASPLAALAGLPSQRQQWQWEQRRQRSWRRPGEKCLHPCMCSMKCSALQNHCLIVCSSTPARRRCTKRTCLHAVPCRPRCVPAWARLTAAAPAGPACAGTPAAAAAPAAARLPCARAPSRAAGPAGAAGPPPPLRRQPGGLRRPPCQPGHRLPDLSDCHRAGGARVQERQAVAGAGLPLCRAGAGAAGVRRGRPLAWRRAAAPSARPQPSCSYQAAGSAGCLPRLAAGPHHRHQLRLRPALCPPRGCCIAGSATRAVGWVGRVGRLGGACTLGPTQQRCFTSPARAAQAVPQPGGGGEAVGAGRALPAV